jgi:hypothetical protein
MAAQWSGKRRSKIRQAPENTNVIKCAGVSGVIVSHDPGIKSKRVARIKFT